MVLRSSRARHFEKCEETSRLHFFLISFSGPDFGQPAAFQFRKATRLCQHRVNKKVSDMRGLTLILRGFVDGMVETEMARRVSQT